MAYGSAAPKRVHIFIVGRVGSAFRRNSGLCDKGAVQWQGIISPKPKNEAETGLELGADRAQKIASLIAPARRLIGRAAGIARTVTSALLRHLIHWPSLPA
jgi:hypothetical protein